MSEASANDMASAEDAASALNGAILWSRPSDHRLTTDHLAYASPHALDDVSMRAEEWLLFRSRPERDLAIKALRNQGIQVPIPIHGDQPLYHTFRSGNGEHQLSTLLYPIILTPSATLFARQHAAQGSIRLLDTRWDTQPATLDEALRIEHMRDSIRLKKSWLGLQKQLSSHTILIHGDDADHGKPTLSAWFTDPAKARNFIVSLSQSVPDISPEGTPPGTLKHLDIGGKILHGISLPHYPAKLVLEPFITQRSHIIQLQPGMVLEEMVANPELNKRLHEAYKQAAQPIVQRGRCG